MADGLGPTWCCPIWCGARWKDYRQSFPLQTQCDSAYSIMQEDIRCHCMNM